MKDLGVYVIVADACITCVYGLRWRKNAESKFQKLGFNSTHMNNNEADFTGHGKKKCRGKFKIPLAPKLLHGPTLPGAVCSHEVEDSPRPLILSQNCQANLGMVKNMRGGITQFEELSSGAADSYSVVHDTN